MEVVVLVGDPALMIKEKKIKENTKTLRLRAITETSFTVITVKRCLFISCFADTTVYKDVLWSS